MPFVSENCSVEFSFVEFVEMFFLWKVEIEMVYFVSGVIYLVLVHKKSATI